MLKNVSDYDLVMSYQKSKKDIYYNQLYFRYEKYIKKQAFLIYSKLNFLGNRDLEIEDIQNEFRICLLKAIQQTKIEKINNKENFKIFHLLNYEIKGYFKEECKLRKRESISIRKYWEENSKININNIVLEEKHCYNIMNNVKEKVKNNKHLSYILDSFFKGETNKEIERKVKSLYYHKHKLKKEFEKCIEDYDKY